jgi:hypothetical protein
MFNLRCRKFDIFLPLVLLTLVTYIQPFSLTRWQFPTSVIDTSGKFTADFYRDECTVNPGNDVTTGVVDTCGRFTSITGGLYAAKVVAMGGQCTLNCEYLCQFLKTKLEIETLGLSGAKGR